MKYNSDILRHLHTELKETLREVVRVCEVAQIPYFIQGGTAIGSHFFDDIVPWDDDIDLGMTRENYERFLREAPAILDKQYTLQEFTTEPDTPFYFAKVRKIGTRFVESEWVGLPIAEGVYIDIFPYDLIPDDERLARHQRRRVGFWINCFMAKSVWLWRWLGKANNSVVFPKSLVSCLAIRVVSALLSKERIYHILNRELTRYNNTSASRYNIVRMPKDMIAVESIAHLEPRKFGDLEVMAPANLEVYLRSHYGDIQKWLPEDKRLNHAPEVLWFGYGLKSRASENISVVIPLYNKEAEVERALRSVVEQSLAVGEIIVVNDGSTDNSESVVKRFIDQHPEAHIRLITQPNSGVSATRNRGIEEAKGEYVALLDADDWWLSNYIAEVCRLMEYYPDCDAYSTAFDVVNNDTHTRAYVPTTEGYISPAEEALKGRYPIIPSTATLRRSTIQRCGGFPEGMRIGEDQWLWVRMIQQKAQFAYSPISLVRYSRSASNRSASIYRAEGCWHTIAELYDPKQEESLNEYIARIGIGKAITQSVRGGDEDAKKAIRAFDYTKLSKRQLTRLKLLNSLPASLRPALNGLYATLAWAIKRRGL
ncbi:MAG: LicD family protein [Alistipes sp.]|nr:LicD family protein [Alistipes sp.]